ncbi:MAG: ABC transporter permease [Gordonia sp. (in: high G+C Gram-positive bacteria)]
MARYLARRTILAIIVVAGLVVMAFLMAQILPGDPARAAAGRNATAEQVDAARRELGLDRPLVFQFVGFAQRILHGNLGESVFTHRSVSSDIAVVLPSSIELVVSAMVINVVFGVSLGVCAAYYRGRAADVVARIVGVLGSAIPVFWLALILQLVCAVKLHMLPLYGQLSVGQSVSRITGATTLDALLTGDTDALGSALIHLVLPALTLSATFISVITRTVRSSMITTLDADYVTLARATGASEGRVVVVHALRNALGPVITILGMQLGWMLGATVLVESTFNRTGIGAYMVTAVVQNDLYAVIGSILIIGIIFIFANIAVDLIQLALNSQLRDELTRRNNAQLMRTPRKNADVVVAADGVRASR